MKYSDIGDNELIYLIRCDNQEAKGYLIKRYQKRIFGIIDGFSKKYLIKGLDYEDYFHNCFIVFLRCVENFDEDYNFFSYVHQAVERELYKLINEELFNRDILSIDDELVIKDRALVDVVSDSSLIYKGNEIKEIVDNILDDTSREVFKYRLQGYSCLEIAKMLNTNKKSIYKKVSKMKEILKEKI